MGQQISNRWRLRVSVLSLLILACSTLALAQYELPDEIFHRTLLIRYHEHDATGFKFDHDGHVYIVTTRHFAKNLPGHDITLQLWQQQRWSDCAAVRINLPPANDVDLAILETTERIGGPYKVVKSSETLTTGQRVWIMGRSGALIRPKLPDNMPTTLRPVFADVPFIKIGSITEITPTISDSIEIQVQGSLARGIGGGPIVYWSPVHRDYEVLGVLKRDPREELPPKDLARQLEESPKTSVVRGYSIDYVVDAIKRAEQEKN